MRYEYFVSFTFQPYDSDTNTVHGNTTMAFDHPIRECSHIRQMEEVIRHEGYPYPVVNNYILLNRNGWMPYV